MQKEMNYPKNGKKKLDFKICIVCLKPFSYRKKWRNCWKEVKYCSEKCRRNKNNLSENKSLFSIFLNKFLFLVNLIKLL